MDALVALAIVALLVVVVWMLVAPLRAGAAEESATASALEELEVEKETKYREIRDAEMDHRTGKLDETDWKAVDRQLRAEAVAILREMDRLGGEDR